MEACSARELAPCVLQAFPKLADLGVGRDWAYVGWLTELLGVVEQGANGRHPIFYADYPIDLDA